MSIVKNDFAPNQEIESTKKQTNKQQLRWSLSSTDDCSLGLFIQTNRELTTKCDFATLAWARNENGDCENTTTLSKYDTVKHSTEERYKLNKMLYMEIPEISSSWSKCCLLLCIFLLLFALISQSQSRIKYELLFTTPAAKNWTCSTKAINATGVESSLCDRY